MFSCKTKKDGRVDVISSQNLVEPEFYVCSHYFSLLPLRNSFYDAYYEKVPTQVSSHIRNLGITSIVRLEVFKILHFFFRNSRIIFFPVCNGKYKRIELVACEKHNLIKYQLIILDNNRKILYIP